MTLTAIGAQDAATRAGKELPAWQVRDGMLVRRFKTTGMQASLLAAGAIVHLAELAYHHPDLLVTFGGVEVRLTTHDAGGISERDFALAAAIDRVMDWRPDGQALTGPDQPTYLKQGA